jgi:hypothetical protein
MWHFNTQALLIGRPWSNLILDSNVLLNYIACMEIVPLLETFWGGNLEPTLLP